MCAIRNRAAQASSALNNFRVQLPNGGRAPLFTVASVEESRAYSSIRARRWQARCDGDGRRGRSADHAECRERRSRDAADPGTRASSIRGCAGRQAGSTREQNEDLAAIGSAFVIVLLVIFALIATQLRSYLQPLAIHHLDPAGRRRRRARSPGAWLLAIVYLDIRHRGAGWRRGECVRGTCRPLQQASRMKAQTRSKPQHRPPARRFRPDRADNAHDRARACPAVVRNQPAGAVPDSDGV